MKVEVLNEILNVINNQIKTNNPKCINELYDFLISKKVSEKTIKYILAFGLSNYITNELTEEKYFKEENYKETLKIIINKLNYKTVEEDIDNLRKVNNLVEIGYNLKSNNGRLFKQAWNIVKTIFENQNIKSIEEFDKIYCLGIFMYNWIQDTLEFLSNDECYEDIIDFTNDIIPYFEDKSLKHFILNCKSDALEELGRKAEAIKLIEDELKKYPKWGMGYGILSYLYEDIPLRKIDILIKASKIDDLEDIDIIYEILDSALENFDEDNEKIKEAKRALKNMEQLVNFNYKQYIDDKDKDNFFPLADYSETRKDDLCPCGSGLQYKQCCGKID